MLLPCGVRSKTQANQELIKFSIKLNRLGINLKYVLFHVLKPPTHSLLIYVILNNR
jgi:hypothetical protein